MFPFSCIPVNYKVWYYKLLVHKQTFILTLNIAFTRLYLNISKISLFNLFKLINK